MRLRVDTESIGFMGPVVLIQTGFKGEEPDLWNVWQEPINKTLSLIDEISKNDVLLYNASFDSFKLHQLYNTLLTFPDKNIPPDPENYFALEKFSFQKPYSIKPPSVLDYYLILLKYFFPDITNRKPIEIRRVPIQASDFLFRELEKLQLHPLLFKKFKNKTSRWDVEPDDDNFVNFKLSFKPSLALKAVIKHLFNLDTKSINIPPTMQPKENEWDPYGHDWRPFFKYHCNWWYDNSYARQYASEDIQYLDLLEDWINAQREITFDQDSELAWMVGAVRFKGYPIDMEQLESLLTEIQIKRKKVPISPVQSIKYLKEAAPPILAATITNSSEATLRTLAEFEGELGERAKNVIETRELDKQTDLLQKLQLVGRFHPDFNVCGTKSNRMSGRGGINPQGINKDPAIRECFLFKSGDETLCGGDFDGQEVTIFDAIVNDEALRSKLLAGIKIHTIMAQYLFETDKPTPEEYYTGKQCVFALIYGAEENKLSQVSGLSVEKIREVMSRIKKEIPGFGRALEEMKPLYAPASQNPESQQITWLEPKEEIGSMFGYTRSFRLDIYFARHFFNLASKGLRQPLQNLSARVVRKNKEQSVMGATQSALYASMFNILSSMLRVANNHRIQATGAGVTKTLQYNIWQLQPTGISPFVVAPFNVHDEVITPTTIPEKVNQVVEETIMELRKKIPLLKINWKTGVENWAEIK